MVPVPGFVNHMGHETIILSNLFLLLVGFALLALIFVLSAFLDNIAAALIGGTIAKHVFRGKVHIGYLAAIVAASNAGGSGSVVGDTTTTMMWIDGVSPMIVLPAFVASVTALLVFGIPAAFQQHKMQPIATHAEPGLKIDWARISIVLHPDRGDRRERDGEPQIPGPSRPIAGAGTGGRCRNPNRGGSAQARLGDPA
jgi:hypothetical protein